MRGTKKNTFLNAEDSNTEHSDVFREDAIAV